MKPEKSGMSCANSGGGKISEGIKRACRKSRHALGGQTQSLRQSLVLCFSPRLPSFPAKNDSPNRFLADISPFAAVCHGRVAAAATTTSRCCAEQTIDTAVCQGCNWRHMSACVTVFIICNFSTVWVQAVTCLRFFYKFFDFLKLFAGLAGILYV